MDIFNLLKKYSNNEKTTQKVVEELVIKIKKEDHKYNSIQQLNNENENNAKILDKYFLKNNKLFGQLHGIPIILKANIKTKDAMTTSCGSVLLRNNVAKQNAFIVKKLIGHGALIIAKSNMSEFCNYVSNSSENGFSSLGGNTYSYFGQDNPVGGSSSGSAVAAAAEFSPITVGTETDGSVVYPASLNGVFGFKPSNGKISTDGIIGISKFFDSLGLMSKSIDNIEYVYKVLTDDNSKLKNISNILIEKQSFENCSFEMNFLNALKRFLKSNNISFKNSNFCNDILAYHLDQDIICQTEFKQLIVKEMEIPTNQFFQKCQDQLLNSFYNDINEIKRSVNSIFDMNGEYQIAINRIKNYRKKFDLNISKNAVDAIIGITTCPHEKHTLHISSISSILGLPHITVPISTNSQIPLGLSIIGKRNFDMAVIDLAKKIYDYYKPLN